MLDLTMWSYWRDKYGAVEALESYFPELAQSDPVLAAALAQIKVAHAAIEGRMRELESGG